ncbi:hypothetical protein CO657_19805 [Rhizobium acidisoli]|uniref:Uncharacterized protein n=1 Tax=Rhizobium acidisoli TaxID=1538158 RepID=A0AAE5WQQ7_9HYPH|nr:hypothetical protein [Rhizobium acidisoli]KPH09111.1 hypothetical protein AOG23_07475 [Rhizobium acidisoli]QAS80177.1 hypothetical protein CO657_19805 [Rhizobium acidisoli]
MSDDIEFEVEEAPAGPLSARAEQEAQQFQRQPPKPNTAMIPLWKNGHLAFNPESSVSIFALIALVLLLLTVLISTFVGIWVGDTQWMAALANALGHAVTGVVGAIVGSSVAKKSND